MAANVAEIISCHYPVTGILGHSHMQTATNLTFMHFIAKATSSTDM